VICTVLSASAVLPTAHRRRAGHIVVPTIRDGLDVNEIYGVHGWATIGEGRRLAGRMAVGVTGCRRSAQHPPDGQPNIRPTGA
jgi:hypothetical protein